MSRVPSFVILLALMVLSGGTIYVFSLIVRLLVWVTNLRRGECKACGGDQYLQPCDYCGEGVKRERNQLA